MSFARNIGNNYGRKIFDKSLDVGKIVDRITKSTRNKEQKEDYRIMEETQEKIIPPEKREQIIRDLKLF